MRHGGDIYRNRIRMDYSVSLNPLGPPETILEALKEKTARLRVYPDPEQTAVRDAIAAYEHVDTDRVIAGSGASELFMAIARAVRPKRALLFEPGYTGYAHALQAAGCEICSVILPEDRGFALSGEDASRIDEVKPDVVILSDPVNPTGKNPEDEVLTRLIDRAEKQGCAVILDESFMLLSGKAEKDRDGSRNWLKNRNHVFVVRSLTKTLALPGIRMGYALSGPRNITEIEKQLPEWNLSTVSEEAIVEGCAVLGQTDYLRRSHEMIVRERAFLSGALSGAGLKVFPSDTCYLLFCGPAGLYEAFLKRGILIRDCGGIPGLRRGFCRIAVKDHTENLLFAENLREVMHEL